MDFSGVPGWLSWFLSLSPAYGSVLTAQRLKPALDSVSPSLSAPPLFMVSLSLSKINKHLKIQLKPVEEN